MSSHELYLGVDLGTTSVKATILDGDFHVRGRRRVEYKTIQRFPLWVEQDPWEWWKATELAVQEVLAVSETDPRTIRAIGVSSQAPSLMGLEQDGNPTGPAMIWMDRRSEEQCEELRQQLGEEEMLERTGNRIDPYYMLPKLMWQKQKEPERFRQTSRYIQANGWIVYQLTGKTTIDDSHAALTQLYNLHSASWDAALLEELGIPEGKLPDIYGCHEVVGGVQASMAERFGFLEGTPVVAGAIDGATAPLGLKLIKPGQVFEMSGQSSGIGMILDRPIRHRNLALLKHAVNNQWILKGSMSATGGSLQWFRDCIDERSGSAAAYELYDEWVQTVPPGSRGLVYLPYLAGERAPLWDSNARGVFFGLQLNTSKADMIRAIMEGTAFGLRSILEVLGQAGLSVQQIYGTGGGYLSRQWAQIKADILERRIDVLGSEVETASVGAAYLAMIAYTQRDPTSLPAAGHTISYVPNEAVQPLYQDYYIIFQHLYERNKDLFKFVKAAGDCG